MTFKNDTDTANAFEAFLKKLASDPEVGTMIKNAREGAHISDDDLRNHVAGGLDPVKDERVLDHILFCMECSERAERIRDAMESAESVARLSKEEVLSQFQRILESRESFEAFINEAANSPEFRALQEEAAKAPPIPRLTLVRYVLNQLDADETYEVMERLSLDPVTAEEVDWLAEKMQTVDDLMTWFNQLTGRIGDWFGRLRESAEQVVFEAAPRPRSQPDPMQVGLALQFMSPESMRMSKSPAPPAPTIRSHGDGPFKAGSTVDFDVECRAPGYLWALSTDLKNHETNWVFPNQREKDNTIQRPCVKTFGVRIAAAPGPGLLKAVLTREQIIDPEKVNFANRFAADEAAAKFLKGLRTSHCGWAAAGYEYRVEG
jgi:anti-sigma factor RsiW